MWLGRNHFLCVYVTGPLEVCRLIRNLKTPPQCHSHLGQGIKVTGPTHATPSWIQPTSMGADCANKNAIDPLNLTPIKVTAPV